MWTIPESSPSTYDRIMIGTPTTTDGLQKILCKTTHSDRKCTAKRATVTGKSALTQKEV
jgi:hypothetical protein